MKSFGTFEGTIHIKDADLQKMAKLLADVNIKKCPYFDLSDKYGNSARYYRENRWIPCSERLPDDGNLDTISRRAAIDAAGSTDYTGLAIEDVKKVTDKVIKALKQLPSAQPKPKTGKWIYGKDKIANDVDGYRCNQCDYFVPWDYTHKLIGYIEEYNFCPNCGADMSEKGDELR